MRQHITRPWLFGSALLLGLAGSAASAQEPAAAASQPAAPKQKALISFDGSLFSRWKSEPKVAESQPSGQQKALLPPNSILNRQYPPQTSPAVMTPLPPTSAATGQPVQQAAAHLQPQAPQAQPIATSVPAGANLAQMAQAQSPFAGTQTPVIIMVPPGWQPDGSVTFAPRAIVSPEVPAEHWPAAQRNPFGDDRKKGLFTWPEIARKMTSETLREGDAPPRPASKALLARSPEPAPAPAPAPSKALFGPQPAATESVEAAPRKNSRALFNFGHKSEAVAEAPASAPNGQMATGTPRAEATPMPPAVSQPTATQHYGSDSLAPNEQPPAAPELSEQRSEPSQPPVRQAQATKPAMNWRSKGSLSSTVVETPAEAEVPPAETAAAQEPATEEVVVVQNLPAAEEVETVETAQPLPQSPAAEPAVSTERSLLGKYFPQMVSPSDRTAHTPRDPWQRQAKRDALAASNSKRKTETQSKALVPNLASMVPGLESHVQHASNTGPVAAPAAAVQRVPHYETPSHATQARATHSYYAPPADHIVAVEMETAQPQPPSSRRHAERFAEADDRVPAEQTEAELEVVGDDPFRERMPPPPPAHGMSSHDARRAPQKSAKGYRRLTGDDVAAGISRPFAALSEFTKLPQAVTKLTDSLDPQQQRPDYEPRQRIVSQRPVKRYRLFDEAGAPAMERENSFDAAGFDDEAAAAEAPAPGSGRRRVRPTVTTENKAAVNELPRPATQIRNKHGVRVTIYSGNELSHEDQPEQSADREAAYTAGSRDNRLR